MGIDLTVLPNRFYDQPGFGDGYNRLEFWRETELFDRIRELKSFPLESDRRFTYYSDDGIERTLTDAYGSHLEYVEAWEFINVHSDNQWNNAVIQFLRSLPLKMPVVLYWH